MTPANEEHFDQVFDAVAHTMENMAFLEVLPLQKDQEAAMPTTDILPEYYWAVLPVLQPAPGSFILTVSGALMAQIAESLFGPSEEFPSEPIRRDAIAELVNIIGGRILASVDRPGFTFQLGLPDTGSGKPRHADDAGRNYYFHIDGHPLTLRIHGNILPTA